MQIPNAVEASLWVPNVITHAPLSGEFAKTNMEVNREIVQGGHMAVSERMYAARDPVSNFGNETHIGKGINSQISRQIMEESVESIARIMERDDEYEGSQMGDYTTVPPAGFQELNDRSFETQQRVAANAYKYFANYARL